MKETYFLRPLAMECSIMTKSRLGKDQLLEHGEWFVTDLAIGEVTNDPSARPGTACPVTSSNK